MSKSTPPTADRPSATAAAVHALAQPLSAAASTSELLLADWDELTEADRRDLARRVDRNVRRLTELLRGIGSGGADLGLRRPAVPVAESAHRLDR